MASFNTTVRQVTEMFQWPKCLNKNDRNVSAKKTQMQKDHPAVWKQSQIIWKNPGVNLV